MTSQPAWRTIAGLGRCAALALSACGGSPTPTATPSITPPPSPTATPSPTSTPDPCAGALLVEGVAQVHALMREFDDTSLLAQNTPIQSVTPLVSEMQRIRRAAEDQAVPACLADLQAYQLAHMNAVLETYLAFLSGSDADVINPLVERARGYHGQYTAELGRLLGWTPVPEAATATPEGTPASP